MQPEMAEAEVALLTGFLRCSRRFLEFGCGGSTVLAASLVGESVVSVDSSREWIAKVADRCAAEAHPVRPAFVLADIGPTGDWGYPSDPGTRFRWPDYHGAVWSCRADARNADLFLVDGRFRVACFVQILLRAADPTAPVIVHDFADRPQYHVVLAFAREVARVGLLSVFQRRADFDAERATACLARHAFEVG